MESLVKENHLTAVCERAHRGSHVTEKVDLIRFLKLAQKMTYNTSDCNLMSLCSYPLGLRGAESIKPGPWRQAATEQQVRSVFGRRDPTVGVDQLRGCF